MVPWADHAAKLTDVERQRFTVQGRLVDVDGAVFTTSEGEVDLRNGFDVEASLYFGSNDRFRAGWTFDMGNTCASLGADEVLIELSGDDSGSFGYTEDCEAQALTGYAPPGRFTARAVAYADGVAIAASEPGPEVQIDTWMLVDLGTFVLTPCGGECD